MSGPELALVVAAARGGTIGRDGAMPWRQPTDLARFKALTMGAPILMGRTTFESIGRPLPGRVSIVLSRGGWAPPEGVHLARYLDAGLRLARAIARRDGVPAAHVIGGGRVYAQALAHVDTVHLTRIEAELEGDAAFPDLADDWEETAREAVPAGPRDDHDMTFLTYRRRAGTA